MQIQAKQNFAIFKRISSAILIVLVVTLSINLWQMQSQSVNQWYEFESEQLGRSLARQASKLIAPSMVSPEEKALDEYIAMITNDDFVQTAMIFSADGQRLHQTKAAPSIVSMVSQTAYRPLVFVEDITSSNGEILGYLKLILDREQVTSHHRAYVNNQLIQTIITVVLTFIIAALTTRIVYKFRYRHLVNDESEIS